MKKYLFTLSAALLCQAALAQNIEVKNPQARATVGQIQSGAFMQLVNTGNKDDALIQAHTDASITEKTELHNHIMENGLMKMRKVDSIAIKAGQTQELKPGGYHIMFLGLKKDLVAGQTFPVELTFQSGEKQTINVKVVDFKNQPMKHHHHHH
ncbi:MAG: copper chaperone PCu(A)C [Neisseriaceae bacterium]|nr:copper chaperone PCu(A)C [Neisseriaceae bacterium]